MRHRVTRRSFLVATAGASAALRPSGRLFQGDTVPMAKYGLAGHMATAVMLNGELAAVGFDHNLLLNRDGWWA